MASYDYITSGAYVLEAGKYEVKLMKNAHEVIASETVEVPSTIVYGESNKRSSDLAAAVNRFDDANVRFTEGHSYLSRNDWEGTWPKAEYAVSSLSDSDLAYLKGAMSAGYQIAGDPNLSAFADTAIVTEKALTASDIENVRAALKDALADNEEAIAELAGVESGTVDLSSMTTLQSSYQKLLDGKLVFALMTYFDYESPVWNTLLDQLSLADLSDVVTMGGYRTAPIDAIEKSVTMDIDGPAGMQPFLGFGIDIQPGVGYATEVTLASTWNVELAEEMGVCVGEFANTQNVSGWYAPAMNGHRSPFAGRNFEYYSEDPYLAGKFAAAATRGARSQGIWVYLKHFALNDQELHRDQNGILTFSHEQAIRELYCKPFEIAVKEGEATGVMSAFNRIGLVWAGGSRALCTDVLRSEWGFKGTVITDFYMNWGSTYMNAMEGVLAGNDLYLNPFQGEAVTVQAMQGSNQLAQAARQSVKNILYMTSRGEIVSFHVVSSWRPLWIVGNVVCGVLLAMAAVWLVRGIVKKKEK
jgi:beta-glucosidase